MVMMIMMMTTTTTMMMAPDRDALRALVGGICSSRGQRQ